MDGKNDPGGITGKNISIQGATVNADGSVTIPCGTHMALRTEIVEVSNDDLLLASISKKFRPALATFDGVPQGTHVTTLAIASSARLNNAQMTALEAAVAAIAGGGITISACKVLSQGPTNGIPTLPAGYQVNLRVETAFDVSETP